MPNHDPNHQETQKNLPRPLDGTGPWSAGAWQLPANTLSVVSALVFVVVVVFLTFDERLRTLFRLAFHPAWAAGATALAGWVVLLDCRRRPGRLLPRLWTLSLALGASVLLVLCLLPSLKLAERPVFQATVIAGLAAALSLLPRLVKLRPDSRTTQRIAPLSLLLVLALILPSACYVGRSSIHTQEQRIEKRIRDLERAAHDVREVIGHDWSRLAEEQTDAARARVDKLASLEVDPDLSEPGLWAATVTLGRGEELDGAVRGLIDAVAEGLDPRRAPKLSTLPEPAIWWDPEAQSWQASTRFPELSEVTGLYHLNLGRIFDELKLADGEDSTPALADLGDYHQEKRGEVTAYLDDALHTWTDHWVVFRVPGHDELTGRARMPLAEILEMPLMDGETPAPADLWQLLRRPLSSARMLGHRIPGCHPREYAEEEYEYFRLDCYTYSPEEGKNSAVLRLDLRLVYRSPANTALREDVFPVEVYFLFPIPRSASQNAFRDEVMSDLHAAVKAHWPGPIRARDRGGAVRNGFDLRDENARVRVLRPTVEPYYDQQSALAIRAVLEEN